MAKKARRKSAAKAKKKTKLSAKRAAPKKSAPQKKAKPAAKRKNKAAPQSFKEKVAGAYHTVVDTFKGTDTLRNKLEQPGTSESE